jgi:hypothetical protein
LRPEETPSQPDGLTCYQRVSLFHATFMRRE